MKVILLLILTTNFIGCAAIAGLKEIKRDAKGNTTYSFITGYGASITANGIDTVNDNRGIKPSEK